MSRTASPTPSPTRRVGNLAGRIVATPWMACAAIVLAAVVGLGLDAVVGVARQPVLGLCAWLILAGLLVRATREERSQTLIVVIVATFFEIVGSVWWGVYTYRYGNLPTFVPPGHGMVYLFGLRLTQTAWGRRNGRLMVRLAIAGVLVWAIVGLTLLERRDVAGAIGAVVLALFLVCGRAPATYAGVFFYVAFLELYGTALGTWYWLPEVPHLGVPNGNPPSGIAGGYVFFDMAALALAPFALWWWDRGMLGLRRARGAPQTTAAEEPAAASAATGG